MEKRKETEKRTAINMNKILLSDTQYDSITCDDKFIAVTGAYKFGKTYQIVRLAIEYLRRTNQSGLIAEPTYSMNERLIKPEIESYMNSIGLRWKYYGSPKNWYTTDLGDILLRSQDNRTGLEGNNLGWFITDELDLQHEEKANEISNVLISKLTLGSTVPEYSGKTYGAYFGTNEGFKFMYNTFYKDAKEIYRQNYISKDGIEYSRSIYQKGEYKLFMGATMENEHNLPNDYITTLINAYDEKLLKRYLHGEFVSITQGQVYYNFDRGENTLYVPFNPTVTTHMTWDVNFSDKPMCTSLIQELTPAQVFGNDVPDYIDKSKILYVTTKHFANENSNTVAQCEQIYNYLNKNNFIGKLDVFGDRVGHDRRVGASSTHYQIVADIFQNYGITNADIRTYGTRRTRSIVDRISCLNRMLKNPKGKRSIIISTGNKDLNEDRGLKKLIEDYEQCSWTVSGNKLDDSTLGRTDPTDAESYYYYNAHDLVRIQSKMERL